jgi:large subunit ribosomal protein L4
MPEIKIYDAQGAAQGTLQLDKDIKKKALNTNAFAQVIRLLRQNWRQGTVSCKSRGELAFSNRKPWRQKGTGRARAGTPRSPLWRKGGVIFGPNARVRKLNVNTKIKKLALNNLLFFMLDKGAVYCLDFTPEYKTPKTKEVYKIIKNLGLKGNKINLFIPFDDIINFASFRNIAGVNVLSFDQPNTFDLSVGDCWIFLKKDLEKFKEMILQWN